jgi:hypothetical protein
MTKGHAGLSRRGFLALGGAAVSMFPPLRRLLLGANTAGDRDTRASHGSSGSVPDRPYVSHQYSLTGGWTESGFLVSTQLDPVLDRTKSVELVVSSERGMDGSARFGPAVVGDDGIVRHTVTGLPSPLTRYRCRLKRPKSDNLVGDLFHGWTGPSTAEADYTIQMVLGSCCSNPGTTQSQVAFEDAVAQNAPVLLHLGDWGYWGQHIGGAERYVQDLRRYTKANTRLTQLRALIHHSNLEGVCISDHELHTNGDTFKRGWSEDTLGCPHSARQYNAHKTLFPVRAWGDAEGSQQHRGYYTDLAPHVRLVVSDFRSTGRDLALDPDGGPTYKQMWNAAQEAWLFDTAFDVGKDVVILFANETAWWRKGRKHAGDKPASYPDAQNRFMDRLRGVGDFAGMPPIIDRFAWLGGDRHYCGYLSRADAQRLGDGFPQFIGSGWYKDSLSLNEQEYMTWTTPVTAHPGVWFPVAGYLHLTLRYQASTRTVSLTGIGRAVPSTHRLVDDAMTRAGSRLVRSRKASFSDHDIGRFISGEHIPDGNTIVKVNSPKSAVMDKSAVRKGAHVEVAISSDPAEWVIQDFPASGGPFTETFQL